MPQFKNTADLMAYLKKAVDESLRTFILHLVESWNVQPAALFFKRI